MDKEQKIKRKNNKKRRKNEKTKAENLEAVHTHTH